MKFKMAIIASIMLAMTSALARDTSGGLRALDRRYGPNGYINNLPLYYGEHEYHDELCSCATKSHTPLPVSRPIEKRTLTRKEREARRQARREHKNEKTTLDKKKATKEKGFFW